MSSMIRRLTPKKGVALVLLTLLLAMSMSIAAADDNHFEGPFHSVDGSGVTGRANLAQQGGGGTQINVVAFGLQPGETYVSLYYDNHVCELEPYSADDVIGRKYVANAGGVGTTHGKIEDDLDEVNSVSVRRASDFKLLACVDVHPLPEGTVGTCATSTLSTVVNTANITFGPDDKLRTGFTLNSGSTFTVCTDSNVPGWTTFKIASDGPVLFVPAGTFR